MCKGDYLVVQVDVSAQKQNILILTDLNIFFTIIMTRESVWELTNSNYNLLIDLCSHFFISHQHK